MDPSIIQQIRDNRTNSNLHLSYFMMGQLDAVALADALKVNSTITNLNLSSNQFGSGGVIALADALKVNSTITNLDLSSNNIGSGGVIALAVNSTISNQNLSSNNIGSGGVIALADALKVNSTISNLDLSSNQFGSEGVIALTDALKVNSTITNLDLKNNIIEDEGINVFLAALRYNTTITNLVLSLSPIATSERVSLSTELKKELMNNGKIKMLYESFQEQIVYFESRKNIRKGLSQDLLKHLQQEGYYQNLLLTNKQNQQENKKKEQLYNSFREYFNFKYPTKILKTLKKKETYIPKKLLLQFIDILTNFPDKNKRARNEIIEKLNRQVSLEYINVIETLNKRNYPFKKINYKNLNNYKKIEKKLFDTYKNDILDKIISSNRQKVNLPKINKSNIQQTNKKLQSMKENGNIHNQQKNKIEANILYNMLPETFIEKYFNQEFLLNPILIKVPDNRDCGFHALSLFLRKHHEAEFTENEKNNVDILRNNLKNLYQQELEKINPTSTIQINEQKRARERIDQLMDDINDQRKWLHDYDMILLARRYGLCFYIRKLDNYGNMVQQIITENGTFERYNTFKEKVIECNGKRQIFLDNPNENYYNLIVPLNEINDYTGLSFQDFEMRESIDSNVPFFKIYDFEQKQMEQIILKTTEIQNNMKNNKLIKKQS